MDRFLKRTRSSSSSSHSPAAKKLSVSLKQGSVSAAIRVAEFSRDKFYVDTGRIFCKLKYCNVVVDHVRKNTVDRNLKSKVLSLIALKFFSSITAQKYWVFLTDHIQQHHVLIMSPIDGRISSISLRSLTPRSSSNAYELTVCYDRHQIKLGSITHWPIINI